MVQVTWPNGQSFDVDASTITRIRKTISSEQPGTKTRIDSQVAFFVTEEAEQVASSVIDALVRSVPPRTLAKATLPGGNPIWFDPLKWVGPIWIPNGEKVDNVKSAIKLGSTVQYLAETPEQLSALITAAGGKPLPIREDVPFSTFRSMNFQGEDFAQPLHPADHSNRTGESGRKPSGTKGTFEDIETTSLSTEEQLALKALRRYDFNFTGYNLYDTIPNYGRGVLVLAEVFRPNGDITETVEYQVYVEDGHAMVFTDVSQTLRYGRRNADWVSRLTTPDTVIAILTAVLLVGYLTHSFAMDEVPEILSTAMTTIIGFWFGRHFKASEERRN